MITKEIVNDKLEILEDGTMQVRQATYFVEDGVRATQPTYHRTTYVPGSDVSKESKKIQEISSIVWTSDVILAYEEKVKKALKGIPDVQGEVKNG